MLLDTDLMNCLKLCTVTFNELSVTIRLDQTVFTINSLSMTQPGFLSKKPSSNNSLLPSFLYFDMSNLLPISKYKPECRFSSTLPIFIYVLVIVALSLIIPSSIHT